MTGTELVALIRSELVEPIEAYWYDTELLAWINQGERDFTQRVHGLQSTATITTVAGRMDYPLPANWLSTRAVFFNRRQDNIDNWTRVIPTNLEKMAQEHPNFLSSETQSLGTPCQYFIWERSIWLRPTPEESDKTVKMFYQSKSIGLTDLSQTLNVDDSLADGIKAYVLWKAWNKEKEMDLAAEQRELYFSYIGEARRWIKKQSGDQAYKIDLNSPVPFTFGIDPNRGFTSL